jgi:uncharacterized membrane protein YfcA
LAALANVLFREENCLIDWPVAWTFIAGGALGRLVGVRLATRLTARRSALARFFASCVALVACEMIASATGLPPGTPANDAMQGQPHGAFHHCRIVAMPV